MTEWFKNICLSPFSYGLDKANIIAVKAITLIFNLYGRRLLKMDNDQIIKHNECKEDRDIFYLYPLCFKAIEQDVGLNVIKIEEGTINDLVVSVPWKAMLSEPTHITISKIDLEISFTQNDDDNIDLNSLENMNSYFAANISIYKENQDLMMAYKEINTLLLQYFNKIDFNIEFVQITVRSYFKITIHNIIFKDNTIHIEKILIQNGGDVVLAEITNINYDTIESTLVIDDIFIDLSIVNHIPDFYGEKSKNDLAFIISVGTLRIIDSTHKMNQLLVKETIISIGPKCILVKKLSYLVIDELFTFCPIDNNNNDVLLFDIENKDCLFKQELSIKIGNISDLSAWFKTISNIITNMASKYVVISLDEDVSIDAKSTTINNIIGCIIYGDDIFDLGINKVCMGDKVIMLDAKVAYDNTVGVFDSIIFDNENGVIFTGSSINSSINSLNNSFADANDFDFDSETTQIIKTDKSLDIYFNGTTVTNIVRVINFVIEMVDKFVTKKEPIKSIQTIQQFKSNMSTDLSATTIDLATTLYSLDQQVKASSPYMVNLHIKNSTVLLQYEEKDFDILIKQGHICITTREATDTIIDVLMNKYLILKLNANYVSSNSILIESLNVFLDPEIFDQLNYVLGTLTPEINNNNDDTEYEISSEGLNQLRQALSKSVISHSIQDLKKSVSDETNIIKKNHSIYVNPTIKILTKSFADLRSALIDDYCIEPDVTNDINLKVVIKTTQINLFDKIDRQGNQLSEPLHGKIHGQGKIDKFDKPNHPFLCAIIKDTEFRKIIETIDEQEENKHMIYVFERKKYNKSKTRTRYILKIRTGAVVDMTCRDPEWKYFVKFSKDNMLHADIIMHENSIRSMINVQTLAANIREVTLLRVLAFLSHSYRAPKTSNPIYIEYFNISAINILVSYYPLVIHKLTTEPNMLTLKNHKMRLSPQIITYAKDFNDLLIIIGKQWKADINPDNILQFIPNIKLFQPIVSPIMQFIQLTTKYFTNDNNKKKIRSITKNINDGADFVTEILKNGITQVWELFN